MTVELSLADLDLLERVMEEIYTKTKVTIREETRDRLRCGRLQYIFIAARSRLWRPNETPRRPPYDLIARDDREKKT